ncbi:F-box domain-containing protein [Mycena sanguinolenta]|uniref:F-box domain-containing protein n=1 Tax=Mycena sanguinolenta TaxID=230812 RepID=A0A8H6ZFW5_9AGAR|nr:F-box domain-containing protein [Mycena sanguinolenta]
MPLCRKCGFDSAPELEETQTDTIPSRTALRNRLSELDALITSLTAERQRLQDVADTIVYPVLSLPTEITTEIFLRCIPPQSNLRQAHSEAPFLLAQICRRWRQLALDTPHLWRSLVFNERETSIDLLQLWLFRSGNLPLDIELKCSEPTRAGPLIETVLLHCPRWRNVKFGLPEGSFSELDLRHASLPTLHSISLEPTVLWAWPESIDDPVTIMHAPSLREVHVSRLPRATIAVPWAQITALTLNRERPFPECMSILEECPNLITLHVSTTEPADGANTNLITLKSLETLTCDFGDASVLEYLTLPRLSRLTVSKIWEPQHATIFSTFIHRSACPLQFLSVEIHSTSPGVLDPFLRAVPDSVSDVEFTWNKLGSTADLFSALQSMDILPELKRLRLRAGTRMYDEEYHNLLEVLRARVEARPPRVPLESMVLDMSPFNSSMAQAMPRISRIAQLRELASAGLKINFLITTSNLSTHVVLSSSVQN